MATGSNNAIRVAVLESPLLATHGASVPLPICHCMQERGLTLQKAQWTAKNTNAGFSAQKRRRSSRHRRKAIQCELDSVTPSLNDFTVSTKSKCQVKDHASVMGVARPLPCPSRLAKPTASKPMEDDSAPSEDVSGDGIDLIACSDVRYEYHQGVPGLCYQLDGD